MNPDQESQECFDAGVKAYREGCRGPCVYLPQHLRARRAWQAGYEQAKEEEKAETQANLYRRVEDMQRQIASLRDDIAAAAYPNRIKVGQVWQSKVSGAYFFVLESKAGEVPLCVKVGQGTPGIPFRWSRELLLKRCILTISLEKFFA